MRLTNKVNEMLAWETDEKPYSMQECEENAYKGVVDNYPVVIMMRRRKRPAR